MKDARTGGFGALEALRDISGFWTVLPDWPLRIYANFLDFRYPKRNRGLSTVQDKRTLIPRKNTSDGSGPEHRIEQTIS